MDQQPNNQPSLDLPAPHTEQYGNSPDQQPLATDTPETQLAVGAEQASSGGPTQGSTPNPFTAPHQAAPSAGTGLSVPSVNPPIADDSDLIEKEWVLKAKHIVEKTRHDPHEQNKAMNRVKADYLKKRYQKDIKLSDE